MNNRCSIIRTVILLVAFLAILPGYLHSQMIVINEIMYNPSEELGLDEHFEFIELYNHDTGEVDLSGWSITQGVGFTFPQGMVMQPGEFLVVARNPDSIAMHYGITNLIGPFDGFLADTGEEIELSDAQDDVVDYVIYGTSDGWPPEPNGTGPSLELIDPASDNSLAGNWYASYIDDGTPGEVNSVTNPEPSITVISPNGGEIMEQGSEYLVTWTSIALENAVRIELLLAGELHTVLTDSTDNTGSWIWVIPTDQPTGNEYTIRISDEEDGDPADESDGNFSVIMPVELPSIVITEIMYHPPHNEIDSIEFVEIYNNHNLSINMEGYYFSKGIEFAFPEFTLAPGEYAVVTQDGDDFLGLFGEPALEWTSGDLNDTGDTLELRNPEGNLIDMVPFTNEFPWDTLADGYGHSLTLCNPNSNNQLPGNWNASTEFSAVNTSGDTIWATPFEGCAIEIPRLVITEIMYDPPENEPDSLEFIEVLSMAAEPVNLKGVYFSSGVEFTFPEVVLEPGGYVLLAKSADAMMNTFGKESHQWMEGNLENTGELIALRDSLDRLIDWFAYSNQVPWDTLAGGYGPSLTLCDPTLDNAFPMNWIASYELAAINQEGDSIFATPGAPCGIYVPEADFEADQTTILMGGSVNFTDLSTNDPTAWLWSFDGGNPAISTEQNPTNIVYTNAGNYDVSLTVTNEFGEDMEMKDAYIHVLFQGDPPVAGFTVSDSMILVGTGVDFIDTSLNHPDEWQWEFPGGSPSGSIEQNPTNIVYQTTGVFDVKLKVTSPFGEDSLTKTGYIQVFDTTVFDLVITEIMYNPPETGTDSLEFIEIYNSGDEPVNMNGFYFSEGIDFIFPVIVLEAGEYLVVAANADAMLSTFGVSALQWDEGALSNSGEDVELSDFFGVVVDYVEYDDEEPWPVIADGGGPSLTLCYPQDDNALAENWTASSEFAAINATGDTIWATPGTGCAIPPIADFTASQTAIAPGGSVDFFDMSFGQVDVWSWIFEEGIPPSSDVPDPSGIQFMEPGIYTVSLAVSNAYGEDSEVKNGYITVGYAPEAEFEASETQITAGSAVEFTDLSIGFPLTWQWQFEGGMPATSTDQNPVITYLMTGDFDVTLAVINVFGESTELKTDYIQVAVGMPDIAPGKSVSVYPNPSDGLVWIRSTVAPLHIELRNLLGERVLEQTLTDLSQPLHLTKVETGIYFMKITDNEHLQLAIIKLIVR